MPRNIMYRALVLRVRDCGEANREADALTAEEGLVRARLYGGPKSKLAAHVSAFNSGALYVYHDPVRDTNKISDFDVKAWRPGLREVYERTVAALSVAEAVLSCAGSGGDWPRALALVEAALDALAGADALVCPRVLLFFLWRWREVLGIQIDLETCASCGAVFSPGERALYAAKDEELLCARCAETRRQYETFLSVGAGCRRYLAALKTRSAADLARFGCDKETETEALRLCTALLAAQTGRPLVSLLTL
jgi:DNA repair protein RecO (recombination protein O)